MAGLFGGQGTGAALTQMGWGEQPAQRELGTPFQVAPTGDTLGPKFPLSGLYDTGSTVGQPRFALSGFDPGELDYTRQLSSQSQANYEAKMAAQQAQYSGSTTTPGVTGTGTGTGAVASLGGDWAGVDKWNAQILAAASQYGVPANLLKSIMKLESGGDPGSFSPQSATGLMQIMPDWNGTAGLSIYDNQQNVMLGAYILKQAHDGWASQGAADPWQEAVRDYIGRGSADAFGTDQNSYWTQIKANWDQLNNASVGVNPGYTGGTGWQSSFTTMFGTTSVPDWGEFNVPSDLPYYSYGNQYGMNGVNHTGVDIPLNVNSPMAAGFSGHVVCSGTDRGTGEDSCSAFNDYMGSGNGRIEIMSNDGNTILIYGHTSRTAVSPGQQIAAGQVVGYSGGENSAHVHLEARVRDPSTPSGWRIVDPRQVLGGGVASYGGGGGAGGYTPAPAQPTNFTDFWLNQYGR